MDNRDKTSLDYLQMVWNNIQHNENMRNRLFQFYLVIAASFLVFFRSGEIPVISGETALLASLFVWLVGFSFLWAYERIREMINRDNDIVTLINKSLEAGGGVHRQIQDRYTRYQNEVRTTSLRWWSLSACIVASTSAISALILAVGVSQVAPMPWFGMICVAIGTLLANALMVRAMNKFAGVPKHSKL